MIKCKKRICIALILLISFTGVACTSTSLNTYSDERNKFWTEDIEYIQKTLPERHHK